MPEAPPALASLLETGIGLARRSSTGKLLFGRLAGVVHADTLPERIRGPVRAELEEGFRRTATPIDARTIEKTLKNAWGKPAGRVVDDFEDKPLSVSPTAQVHAAEHDDRRVAVKVLRPGVASTIRSELSLLDLLGSPLGAVFPSLDVSGALREVRESALDELDLEHEGSQQRRVARALRGVDGVTVAPGHLELAAPDVLVTDLLPGRTLADGARPADPAAAARALIAAWRAAVLDAGLAPLDPRASHVLVAPDGTLGLLGLGVARPVDRARAAEALSALGALASGDAGTFAARVAGAGILGEADAAEAHQVLRTIAGPLLGAPARLDAGALRDLGERAATAAAPLAALAQLAAPTADDLALGRMFGQLVAVLARLGATEDWAVLATEI
jgi:predicted unusual protein kinase regulating ubiquinone biosynthesis (AarF/ABC1/UbiB family)